MIPGDIDLTENLDFRNVRIKELPQLPDTWKGDKNKLNTFVVDTGTTFNISTGYINSTVSTNLYTSTSYQPVSYRWDSISDWNMESDNLYRLIVTYDNGSSFTMYDTDSTTFSTISDNHVRVNFTSTNKLEDKYDIFGNKIIPEKEIPKLPWEKEYEYISSCRVIPWKTYHNDRWLFRNTDDPIPWDVEEEEIYYNLTDKIPRAKNLIPWLFDKTRSFVENYLNPDEEDNSSYLTNMAHIRINDAIIDIV